MVDARAVRRMMIAGLGLLPACTLFVDLDRFDRGGPRSDARADAVEDATSVDVVAPMPDAMVPVPDAEGCDCDALAACCQAMEDPFERDFCEQEWSFRQPDDERCCFPLRGFRAAEKCL